MQNLSRFQVTLVVLFVVLGACWLGLTVGAPLLVYRSGDGALPTVFSEIAPDFGIAALGMGFALFGMLRLNRSARGVDAAGAPITATGKPLRDLVLWIVIALLLVFFFNAFQGRSSGPVAPPGPQHDGLVDILIKALPVIIMLGAWIFVMRRMRAKNKDQDGN